MSNFRWILADFVCFDSGAERKLGFRSYLTIVSRSAFKAGFRLSPSSIFDDECTAPHVAEKSRFHARGANIFHDNHEKGKWCSEVFPFFVSVSEVKKALRGVEAISHRLHNMLMALERIAKTNLP